ncbi:fibronectin type III domain-containing protein 2-like [Haliotis rubra]|uniref:fibronectin type III domain-containing protein 2-like n=1 Tax=Haliotis rubra TaxID=36100 RepID=UPI001EE51F25|nr:fibronectin type III domain-containing protein 2-like [Haliotis rubra]
MDIRWGFMLTALSVASLIPTSTSDTTTTEETSTSTPDVVPGRVNDLTTTVTTSASIGLSWTASSSDVPFNQYVILTSRGDDCELAVYIVCPPNDAIYANAQCHTITAGPPATYDECHGNMTLDVTGLDSNTDYVVTVAAADNFTVGEKSTIRDKTAIGIPAEPTNIRGTVQNQSAILVEWDVPSHNAGPMWYNVTVLREIDRMPGNFMWDGYYYVEGQNSSSLEVTDLLSSWRYIFIITASTKAGTSNEAISKPVRTLPSAPGEVQNIRVKYDHSQYLAVRLTWECPLEKMRNGRITSYTVSYSGNISMTLTAGSFYPEDPCTSPHTVYLPVIPDGKYVVQIWANAEFQGNKSAMIFVADRDKMSFNLPPFTNTTASTSDSHNLVIASATCGSVIAILFVAIIALYLTRSRGFTSEGQQYLVG